MQTARHAKLDTRLGADSVALLGAAETEGQVTRQRAVVGTYSLRNDKGDAPYRDGGLLVVSATREGDVCSLSMEQEVHDIPGVLDVAAQTSPGILYAACANDSFLAFGDIDGEGRFLHSLQKVREVEDPNRILLSVDVCEDPGSDDAFVASSDSAGGISVYRAVKHGWEPVIQRDTHTQEAWSVHIDVSREAMYSGGDDGALVCYDWNTDIECFRLRKAHGGVGVTAVTKNMFESREEGEFHLWSGGYDDVLRFWDIRFTKQCVSEVAVGGGVWRIRFHPKKKDLMLVATMYDGFKVVRRDCSDHLEVLCHYQGHDSMAYGATWVPALDRGDQHVALTGSFYDHSLQLWTFDDNP
ncbi:unnamed protein product [Chondrus crispus]|uniref:methylated diphthine methylhydrolase n=1 Tax=Chondrus crispus TaxID=2769 RepID=R7QCT7_CHOCR|nr:unnamed protein product [Chondrus crispus]CDF36322.1 unnamed protein product [Chondrus crispus]|eukprot:XP_005716141.1 unnamed protein product [Chondrus crispus]